ncbi:aconitate hydratase 1 [Apiospora phragmitis]|uniref:Aconitate hydratase 1 n=1 Tax=Apiospora phragmitis TaxID=2905665 RepID=A0ABR1VZ09_9PEZI
MVFISRKPNPSERKAQINVRLSASPTLFRSNPDAALRLTLTLSLAPSVDVGAGAEGDDAGRGRRPLTFATHRNICEVTEPGYEGGINIFARGGFGLLRSTSGDKTRISRWATSAPTSGAKGQSEDLLERGIRFVTVPAPAPAAAGEEEEEQGGRSAAAAVATVTHTLNWERIFQHADRSERSSREGLESELGINRGYMGTMWWCWGDLETDLRDKRLHVWRKTDNGVYGEKPDEEFVRKGNWVLGENPRLLEWVDVTEVRIKGLGFGLIPTAVRL